MSFSIIEGTWKNTGGFGYLIGQVNFENIIDGMVTDEKITMEEGIEMKEKYDGYQLQIDGHDSVNYYLPGNIEAICMHSPSVGGGHCAGLKYNKKEDEGDPWGLWFTTE